MKARSLRELYVEELRDLYDAEHQISKAFPKLISEVSSEQLGSALNEHLEITKQQAGRIERIFENLGEKLKGKKCKGMEGIIKEGNDVVKKAEDEDVRDAAIILRLSEWSITEKRRKAPPFRAGDIRRDFALS